MRHLPTCNENCLEVSKYLITASLIFLVNQTYKHLIGYSPTYNENSCGIGKYLITGYSFFLDKDIEKYLL